MPSKAIYQCKNCRKDFTVRTADRARGWARFCSKSCKASHQERRTGQNAAYLARQRDDDLADGSVGLMDGHGQWED